MAKIVRRHSVGLGTVGAIAALKPRPPSSPRNSLTDLTNGATGLLSGRAGAGAEQEVARLSTKVMELMSQVQARDGEIQQLQQGLEAARREAANAKDRLALAPAAAPAAAWAAAASATRARAAPPRPGTGGGSPHRKDVMVRVLSAALREADAATAFKQEELAGARAMLAHRASRGPSPNVGGPEAPAPGVVARLQAELAEAAEERRSLRQQLQVRAHALSSPPPLRSPPLVADHSASLLLSVFAGQAQGVSESALRALFAAFRVGARA